jgi:hypothetical protein
MLKKKTTFRLALIFLLLVAVAPWFWAYLVSYFTPDPVFTPFGYEKSHDLLHHYKASQRLLGSDTVPPLVYLYPPLTAWFYLPFCLTSYQKAHAVWMIFNVLLWAGSYLFYRKHFTRGFSAMVAVVFLSFPSLINCLRIGQNGIVSLWIILLIGWALKQKKEYLAGLFLSCFFFKVQLVLPLALLFLLTRQIRVLIGCCAGSIVFLLLGLSLCGISAYQEWFDLMLSDPQTTFTNYFHTSPYGIFQELTSEGFPQAIKLIWLALIITCLILFQRTKKYSSLLAHQGSWEAFFLLIPLTTFLPPYFGLHDWCIVLPTMALLTSRLADFSGTSVPQPFLYLLILCLPAYLYVLLFPIMLLKLPLFFIPSMLWLVLLYGSWLRLPTKPSPA